MPRGVPNNRVQHPAQHTPQRPVQHPASVEGRLRRKSFTSSSAFDINPSLVPDGYCYEWKRVDIAGKEDHQHQVAMTENHWVAVPASRHPELMPSGYTGPIRINDMILMERPLYLTEQAIAEYHREAQMQKTLQVKQLAVESEDGHAPRLAPKISRSYETVEVDE